MDTWVDEWSLCEITNTIRVLLLSQRLAGQWGPPSSRGQQWATGAWAPGSEVPSARRNLQQGRTIGAVRLAVRDTRQAVWELAAPGGTCPLPGDLYYCSLELWFVLVIYKATSGALKVGLLVFLELWLITYHLSCGSG
ncbi:hypothetical protein DEO72_LG11g2399 [Vigna unguiculata]|uniref:Uncharacterized protein n=1 Tax=Vigna unguiculata TaxID=3917 RepID=A0A4D6NPX0_VIGUN|nr:hypothetical protein DEO72_LG11g2399 [Vigna unguiculata]